MTSRLDAFAAGAREAGLTLVNVAVDVGDLAQSDPDRSAADVAELKRWIARCRRPRVPLRRESTPARRSARSTTTYRLPT